MTVDVLREADRLEGFPHPRETWQIYGQSTAEMALLQAIEGDRFHHAWLLTGPKGIGKATLAWRAARFLLTRSPSRDKGLFTANQTARNLEIDRDHPVARRILAMSEPGLLSVRRPWDADRNRFKTQITVEEIRRINSFFGLSATEGGYRVVIIDSADEMNSAAANALLKILEEPPRNAVLFLVSHRPSRLLPTIRSRCRELRLAPLDAESLSKALMQAGGPDNASDAMAELSGGSVGEALRLSSLGGTDIYARIVELLSTAPRMDRQMASALADQAGQRGAEERLELTLRLIDVALARLAVAGAGQSTSREAAEGEQEVLARLSPNLKRAQAWAELNHELGDRLAHGRAVNIDPASLLLDAFLRINETAAQS